MDVHGVLNLNGTVTNETQMTVDGLMTVNSGEIADQPVPRHYDSLGLISNVAVTNAGIIDLGAADLPHVGRR